MIPEDLRSPVRDLLARAGLGDPVDAAPLDGGANNQVYRIGTPSGPVVAKAYFSHPNDKRNRLEAEYAFSRLAWDGGVRALPQPIAADRTHRLALFGFVAGRRAEPSDVGPRAVEAALDFLAAVNRCRARADNLPIASEACFSITAHLETVERRLSRLFAAPRETALHSEAADFIANEVMPVWTALSEGVRRGAGALGIDPDAVLEPAGRCVSPSDFGFHNALVRPGGDFCFLDFEYAGWDDPAKLASDFFNQVAVPVPMTHYPAFRDALAAAVPRPEQEARRFDLLLPVYAVKWITIILNDFLPVGDSRRRFAGGADEAQARRFRQLAKARASLRDLQSRLGSNGSMSIGEFRE